MSLPAFISAINDHLAGSLPAGKGCRLYGLGQSILRKIGSEEQLMPCVMDNNGEYKYIGVDDLDTVALYHKCTSVSTQVKATNAVGDELGDLVDTYTNSIVIYLDRTKARISEYDLLLHIQSNMPTGFKAQPYKNNIVRLTGANMNSRAIFEREYKGTTTALPAEKVLFEINYTIESIFKKNCFDKCLF